MPDTASIPLTLDFASPVYGLSFGFVFDTTGPSGSGNPGEDGVSVELFDAGLSSLGTFTALTTDLTSPVLAQEGLFSTANANISRAIITFGHLGVLSPGSSAGFDNISFSDAPLAVVEPGAFAVFGLGLAAIAFARRRHLRARTL